MSNMQVLGAVRANNATTAAIVQLERNPARDGESNIDMEADKNIEEDSPIEEEDDEDLIHEDSLITTRMALSCS